MAGRIKEAIIPSVRKLITQLTGFHEGEENFELCERFALSNLWHHRFLSVDSHAVRRSIDGIVMKFEVHGHIDTALKLRQLVDKFLEEEVFIDHHQYDIQWSLLSLLLHLAVNPTTIAHRLIAAPAKVQTLCEEDSFDWASYLREGDERFLCTYDYTSSDELDSDSDEAVTEIPAVNVVRTTSSLPVLLQEPKSPRTMKDRLIKNMREIYLAEEWLDANIQTNWNIITVSESTSISKFPSANLAQRWYQHLSEKENLDLSKITIITEYKVIRQILFMFYTLGASQLFQESNKQISVKPGITISSLIADTLKSYLNGLCPYFEMLREFNSFGEDLYKSDEPPPITYKAYWNEVKEFLVDFNNFLISIETKVKKQDGIYTLLKLRNELEPKLCELRCIYGVHVRAVYNWATSSNWLSAASLLSILYGELLDESDNRNGAVILKLFLKTLQVYLNIIDTWLTDGALVDPSEEFVISRNCEVQPYEAMLESAGIQPLPVLKVMVNKVLSAVSSINFLLRLDKLPEVKESQAGLFEDLVESIKEDLSKFVRKPTELQINSTNEKNKMSQKNGFFADVKEHIVHFADPFLLKAFENYLPLRNDEKIIECGNLQKTNKLFSWIDDYFGKEMLPLKPIMEMRLIELVEKKCRAVCCMVKPIFQNEFNLCKHFEVIRGIFLMEAGDIMHQFYSSLFQQIELCEASSFSLSIQLRSCVDLVYPEFSSYFSVVVDKSLQTSPSVYEAINSIKLRYAVDWPISLILTEKDMDLYNAVFQFLMKIKWAVFSLQKLRFSDLNHRHLKGKEKMRAHRLEILRFWLLHSVNSIHNYFMGQVLHSLGLELQRSIEEADNLDSLIKAHEKYVQLVYANCLQTQEHAVIRKPVFKMIWTALKLCEVWEAGVVALSDARLEELEDLHCKCYIFLAVVLSNWVEVNTVSQLAILSASFDLNVLHTTFNIIYNKRNYRNRGLMC